MEISLCDSSWESLACIRFSNDLEFGSKYFPLILFIRSLLP